MWLRRAFYTWLLPAALVLPLWLLVGWGVFRAGGWAFLWVLFIALPSVLIGQIVFALLVRARPSARYQRAVSWWDVAGFGAWHGLTIALGFYPQGWFALLLTAAIIVGIGMVWLLLWQLWAEARGSLTVATVGGTYLSEDVGAASGDASDADFIVIEEAPPADPPRAAH
ncbi:MFS transporter permease [Microbacterium sp. NIBRBAC000506063]|uniref:MFS transporter permease n=1 Tax=Microbacterium sp. NIBRBAC000506063 TaxID=2734618 RepID=UPI001BB6B18A|nr:MFS transporter permease [Microbacterium sp. NIBRBAC000506063]QTV79667.1 MFS transporter permease [Microbacterium sp. NIBRBAC000506063]